MSLKSAYEKAVSKMKDISGQSIKVRNIFFIIWTGKQYHPYAEVANFPSQDWIPFHEIVFCLDSVVAVMLARAVFFPGC